MERLTLDEAIKHAKEVADMNYNDAEKFDSNDSVENYMKANCMKCAEEHEQLVDWLEELKFYKEAEEQGLLVRLPDDLNKVLYQVNYRWTERTEYGEENNKCEIYDCKCECDGIEIKNVDGYIDHQSIDTIDNLMKEYNCTIEEFIFDKGITLVIDNDN